MAINVSFNGATIYRSGAYSKLTVDVGGGLPLGVTGIVGIFGESDKGTPGANEASIPFYTPDQLPAIRAKYGTGPIVDAVSMLFDPASDAAIPSGAQYVYVYKTNASVRASYALENSYGSLRSKEWGIGGNRISYSNAITAEVTGEIESSATFNCTALPNKKFILIVNGGAKNTFTASADCDTVAELVSELATAGNWSGGVPSGVVFTVSGTDSAAELKIAMSADANAHRNGYGKSFEVAAGSPDLLAAVNIVAGIVVSESEAEASIAIKQTRDLITESDTIGGDIVINGKCSANDATSATITINNTQITLVITGGTSAGTTIIDKASFNTLSDLISYINTIPGWSMSIASALYNNLPLSVLDQVTSLGGIAVASGSKPIRLKMDAYVVRKMIAESAYVDLINGIKIGLPDAKSEIYLSGGLKGASSAASIVNALASFEKFRVNQVVPLFSRDATDDIADGLTDSGSAYTIDAIHQAVKTHISLMNTTKRKSERQGVLGYKKDFESCKIKSMGLSDGNIQLVIQDIKQIDASGVIKWFQPHMLACEIAGARCGSPIGTPLTFKYFNISGLRQTGQAMSTEDIDIINDFDPITQGDDAIQSGITFLENPQSGGYRMVVDNTTYGKDGNWVWNRGNSIYAAYILSFDFRAQMEALYVGKKNTVTVSEIKSSADSILRQYLAQGITVQTADAPAGYRDLIITLNGDTINISVVVKLVQGIDFILADITVQRATA